MNSDYDYLKWFRINADFGPSHGDVIESMNQEYERETGEKVPEGWNEE